MKWIGLTGGIASGKSTVANIFRELGVPVVDADQLAHRALERKRKEIAAEFGADVLDSEGQVNRSRLGELVFTNPKKLKVLESMVHPLVKQMALEKKELFSQGGHPMAVYDVPLLFESSMQSLFDEVILVYVPEAVSLERLMKRNHLDAEQARVRISSQMNIEEKKKLANVVFDNQGDREQLKDQVQQYYQAQSKGK